MSAGNFFYAVAKDIDSKREYLVAEFAEDIEKYCGLEKEIISWAINPTPIMVAHHFKWVGKGKRPAQLVISRPFNYRGATKNEGKWIP